MARRHERDLLATSFSQLLHRQALPREAGRSYNCRWVDLAGLWLVKRLRRGAQDARCLAAQPPPPWTFTRFEPSSKRARVDPGAFRGDRGARAVLLALCRPGQPLLAHARGRRRRQGQSDPGGARASAPRHRADPGLFARSQGAVRAHVRRSACRRLRLAGITGIDEGFLKEVYLPQHNARFATPAEDQGTAFVPFAGALDDILCGRNAPSLTTTPCATSAGCSSSPPTATAATTSRPRSGCTSIPTARSPSPRCLARYKADGEPIDTSTRQAALIRFDGPAKALWTSGQPLRA